MAKFLILIGKVALIDGYVNDEKTDDNAWV
jgi:hypothetical protein